MQRLEWLRKPSDKELERLYQEYEWLIAGLNTIRKPIDPSLHRRAASPDIGVSDSQTSRLS